MAWYQIVILIGASTLAGAINAVAGGGTLLSFPALIFAGQTPRIANATNTVALWPGALSSFWAYRSELGYHRREVAMLSVPSILGGVVGAWLMFITSDKTFAVLVPYLILLATALFIVQPLLAKLRQQWGGAPGTATEKADEHAFAHAATPLRWVVVLASQFLVGVYGGYFGAGIGILMLAVYGVLGFSNIHQANAIKNLNAMFINGIAAAIFVCLHLVDWTQASIMAVGAIFGGYAGAARAAARSKECPPPGDRHRAGDRRGDVFQEDVGLYSSRSAVMNGITAERDEYGNRNAFKNHHANAKTRFVGHRYFRSGLRRVGNGRMDVGRGRRKDVDRGHPRRLGPRHQSHRHGPGLRFGRSEQIVGRAIRDRRDRVVLATKCGLIWDREEGKFHFYADDKGATQGPIDKKIYKCLRPASIREEVERSLRNLQTDRIDLLQTHWQDPTTPLAETVGELQRLKAEGKIRAIGVSNCTLDILKAYGPIDSDQERFSMIDRKLAENGILDWCRENSVSVLAYSPLANGLLTGKLRPDREYGEGDVRKSNPRFRPENVERINGLLRQLEPMARRHGATIGQLVIAWTAAQPGMTCVLCGSRDAQQSTENAAAGSIELSAEEIKMMGELIRA